VAIIAGPRRKRLLRRERGKGIRDERKTRNEKVGGRPRGGMNPKKEELRHGEQGTRISAKKKRAESRNKLRIRTGPKLT